MSECPVSHTNLKKHFDQYRQQAITWCQAWQVWHESQMDKEIALDHTRTAQDHMDSAIRAKNASNWLKHVSKTQFIRWVDQYFATDSAVVKG